MLPPSRRLTAALTAAAAEAATVSAQQVAPGAGKQGSKTGTAANAGACQKTLNGAVASGECSTGQQLLVNGSGAAGMPALDDAPGSWNGLPGGGTGNGAADACGRGGTLAVRPRPGRSSRGGARQTAIGPLLKALRAQAAEQGDGTSTFAGA